VFITLWAYAAQLARSGTAEATDVRTNKVVLEWL
jgi:hypothetical protein